MKIQPWIERKWQLGIPSWKVPYLLERLEGTPVRLKTKLKLADEINTRRIADDQWTILEHAGHLEDTESLFITRFREYKKGITDLTPADMSGKKTWKANHNAKSVEDIVEGLVKAREETMALLRSQDDSYYSRVANHPRLNQPMTPADLMYFAAEHEDYHLARITELIKVLL